MSAKNQHHVADRAFAFLPAMFQQQPYRTLLVAGLGTGTLMLATQIYPSLWTSLTSALGFSQTKRRSISPDSRSTKVRTTKSATKEEAELTAIFWDVDNCAPPTGSSGRVVAQAIRTSLQNLELGPIVSFKAYLELSSETHAPNATQVQLRSELQGSGVSLIDTPKSGRKDVADKMMITDLLAFAIDQPAPATIVLISGDRDFAYPLGLLRNRGYEVVLITPPIGAVPILEASANVVLTWRQDVLGIERASNGKPYATSNQPSTPSKNASVSSTPNTSSPAVSSPFGQYSSLAQGRPTGLPSKATRKPSVQSTEVFMPLITLLHQLKKEGSSKPLRAAVAAKLLSIDRSIYVRAGASRWAEYAAVAEAAGIIKLGTSGPPGSEWVALGENAPSADVLASSPASATPTRIVKPASSDVPNITAFYPLIEIVKEQKSQGNPRPLCAYAATQLVLMARRGIVDAYALAGVLTWKEYIAAAEKAGVARSVPTNQSGVYSVEVHPKYLFAQTNQVTPSVDRIVDTATTPTPGVDKKGSAAKRSLMMGFGTLSSKPSKEAITGTTVVNGHEIPARFSVLADTLLEQIGEGRNYSTDYFLHSILGSSRAGQALRVRNADEFQAFLDDASDELIITIEPGFKPGVRHVRLHPRLIAPGSSTAPTLAAPDSPSPATGKKTTNLFSNLLGRKDKDKDKERRDAKDLLDQLNGAPPTSAANERMRFQLLLDVLDGQRVPKSHVSAELKRRNPAPTVGAFYQQLGYTGFTDYVDQALKRGYVAVGHEDSDQPVDDITAVQDYWIEPVL